MLKDGAGRPAELARADARRLGLSSRAVFDTALRGYAAELSPAQRSALGRGPRRARPAPDRLLENATESPTARGSTAPTSGSRLTSR